MKQDTPYAEFKLEAFKFTQFSFKEPEIEVEDLSMDFKPSGEYVSSLGIFNLEVVFVSKAIVDEKLNEAEVLTACIKASFLFPNKPSFQELPSFFYMNSIAILYPYLRAFISTLTLQANTKLLILPILNLVALEDRLRNNTKEVNE